MADSRIYISTTRERRRFALGQVTLRFVLPFIASVSAPTFASPAGEVVLGLGESTRQANSVGQVLLEHNVLQPGVDSQIGLKLRLDPEWHTYWSNPGDSGAAPRFEVRVVGRGVELAQNTQTEVSPGEIVFDPIQFPTPTRIDLPPLTSFAYEGEVMFTRKLRWPRTSSNLGEALKALNVEVEAEWLVCRKECIPARQTWRFEWPVGEQAVPGLRQAEFQLNAERLPKSWSVSRWKWEGRELQLLGVPQSQGQFSEVVDFFPSAESGLSSARPEISRDGDSVRVRFAEDSTSAAGPAQTDFWGLVVVRTPNNASGAVEGFELRGLPQGLTWWRALLFAWAGGLLLNLMPCVLPVISLKMMSLGKLAQQSQREVTHHVLAYTLGVLSCMWVLGVVLAVFRSTGESLGWGFQMQSPGFVIAMFAIFLLMCWALLGRWELGGRWMGWGEGLTQGSSARASYFTGLLAVIVASPCTAPLMAPAMGFALAAPISMMFLGLTALGVGLATPYLLLVLAPSLLRLWPKPGAWMNRLKVLMAMGLGVTALWLIWILSTLWTPLAAALVGAAGVLMLLAMEFRRIRWGALAIALGVLIFAARLPQTSAGPTDEFWQNFSSQTVQRARANGQPVFINYTATWCLTCQVNDRVVFRDADTRRWIQERGVVMLKADWTKSDAEITASLKSFGRAGVPLYVFYPPGGEAKLLPEILTPALFRSEVESALTPSSSGP
ncbi:MAG TPA: thioredoxin family protein [Pseudobdellovibrionaceae bacterium]|nr:thioredoxin family protein [Pseudobdellovibrionaceae bacterium]